MTKPYCPGVLPGNTVDGCCPVYWRLLLCLDGAEGLGELVGTGGGFGAATDALEALDYLRGCHASYEGAYALEVAVASSGKAYVFYLAVLKVYLYLARAGAAGLV